MKVPCKGCTDRQPGCHDKCGKYKAFHLMMKGKLSGTKDM
nr:MAG TPA: hypothetical protein [Caudoviricetes sp.]